MSLRVHFYAILTAFFLPSLLLFATIAEAKTLKELNEEAQRLSNAGKYQEAIPLAKDVVTKAIEIHGKESDDVANAEYNLAVIYHHQGLLKEAEELYVESLRLREKLFGPDHTDVSISLNELALLYIHQNRHSEAEPLIKRTIAIREKAYGRDSVLTSASIYVLAELYRGQGRFEEAEPLFKRVIAICEKAEGKSSPKLGGILSGLAVLYDLQERYSEAEPLFKRALAIGEKSLGPDHPRLGTRLNNLANFYRAQKRYDEAEPLFKRSIQILEKAHGPKHPDLAISLTNLAATYQEQKRYQDALPLLVRSMTIFKDAYGVKHPYVAAATIRLGMIFEAVEQYDRAEKFYKLTAGIVQETLGTEHPWVQSSFGRLADIFKKLGRHEEEDKYRAKLRLMPPTGTRNVRLYFATNRNARNQNKDFGPELSQSTSLGIALARIPAEEVKNRAGRISASFGQLENAKSGKLTKAKLLKIVAVGKSETAEGFAKSIRNNQQRAAIFKNQALVFVHGYNTSFYGALKRATQLSFDLQFDGILIPFSWPSQATITGYLTDGEMSQNSVDALVSFLDTLRDRAPELKIHLLAHSMGNRVVLRALCQIAKRKDAKRHNFGQVIAAHADVAQEDFEELTSCFKPRVEGITLYVNENDTALRVRCAAFFHCRAGNHARGYATADVIDTTQMSSGFFRSLSEGFDHDVFVRNPLLFSDISRLLLSGIRPVGKRTQEFRKKTDGKGNVFWAYDKSYDPATQPITVSGH